MAPEPDIAEMQAFSKALAEGRLLVRHCTACGEHHHYPRSYCPFCGSGATDWRETAAEGTIYSFTIWRRRDIVSIPAFVTLPEGPTLLATIIDSDPAAVAIGKRVRLVATPADDPAIAFMMAG